MTDQTGTKRRRRIGTFGIAAFIAVVGTPAALASVWSINEVSSEFTLTDCLTKIDGADSTNFAGGDTYKIDFNEAATTTEDGVAVLNETLTVEAPAGFRTYSTDAFRVKATDCDTDFTVQLTATATNSFGDAALEGDWTDKNVKIFLATTPTDGAAVPPTGPSNTDLGGTGWDTTPLDARVAPTATVDTSGTATLADDSELQIGFELTGGTPAAAASGTLNFQVRFTPIP